MTTPTPHVDALLKEITYLKEGESLYRELDKVLFLNQDLLNPPEINRISDLSNPLPLIFRELRRFREIHRTLQGVYTNPSPDENLYDLSPELQMKLKAHLEKVP